MLKYNCNTDAIFSKCFGSILLKKENDPDRKPDHMRKSAILFYIIPHFWVEMPKTSNLPAKNQ